MAESNQPIHTLFGNTPRKIPGIGSPITVVPTNTSIGTYSTFATGDVVPNIKQLITAAVWSNTSGSLENFYTSSAQSSSTGDYYYDVYHQNPQTDSATAEVQFAIAYGHQFGSGSTVINDNAGDEGLTPSRAIYSQYRNFLLPQLTEQFGTLGTNSEQIIVINFNRARAPENLDVGNWEVSFSGSAGVHSFIDDSTINASPTVDVGGTQYNIVSGTIEDGVFSSPAPVYYGLMWPEHSTLVFGALQLAEITGMDFDSGSAIDSNNHGKAYEGIKGAATIDSDLAFKARNSEELRSTYYFVRVRNGDYNFSTNPSFYTGSLGEIRHAEMRGDPQTYITTVGLYNEANELLAVAKLSQPLRKNFNREALVRVKLDF